MEDIKPHTSLPGIPAAVGPYSPAVSVGNLVFLSGQIPLDPDTGKLVSGGIEEQTKQVFKNINAVLKGLGLSIDRVVKSTIFLSDLGNFQAVNAIYAEAFGQHRPARSTIQVAGLPLGSLVEIEVLAAR